MDKKKYLHFTNEKYNIGSVINTEDWAFSNYWSGKMKMLSSSEKEFDIPKLPKFKCINCSMDTEIPKELQAEIYKVCERFNKNIRDNLSKVELLKEYIFEDIRQKLSPSLPSRKKCLFLLDTEENAKVFYDSFGVKKKYKIRVETLEEAKPIIRVDASWLDCNIQTVEQMELFAKSYWSGEIKNKHNYKQEILFEGKILVNDVNPVY